MQDPEVSVVIPAFNAEKFLEKTLASVATQTFRKYELIVVDDGSKDKTASVADEFIKKHNIQGRCIVQKNKKIAGALNQGICLARGKWIAILDHDDFWKPEKLEKIIKIAEKNDDYILYWHQINITSDTGNLIPREPVFDSTRPYFDLLFYGFTIAPSSVIFRKTTWDSLGGFSEDENLYTVQDYDFWLRCSKNGRIYFCPKVLADVTRHEGSASQKYIVLHHKNMEFLVRSHITAYFKKTSSESWPRIGRRRLATVYRSCLVQLMKYQKEAEEQRKAASLMLKTCPTDYKNIFQWLRWKLK